MIRLDKAAVEYKYRYRWVPYAWLGIFVPTTCFLTVEPLLRGHLMEGIAAFGLFAMFTAIIGLLLFMSLSDVILDETGLARRALGVEWQRVRWEDVSRLRLCRMINPETGHLDRTFSVTSRSKSTPFLSRRIQFQERQDMVPLVNRILAEVDKREIVLDDLDRRSSTTSKDDLG